MDWNTSRHFNVIKYIGLLILSIILLSCIIMTSKNKEEHTKSELEHIRKAKICFDSIKSYQKLQPLEDVMKSPPKHDKTIFFHDTSCTRDKNGTVTFTAR